MKAQVGAFNKEKALVGALIIVKTFIYSSSENKDGPHIRIRIKIPDQDEEC